MAHMDHLLKTGFVMINVPSGILIKISSLEKISHVKCNHENTSKELSVVVACCGKLLNKSGARKKHAACIAVI